MKRILTSIAALALLFTHLAWADPPAGLPGSSVINPAQGMNRSNRLLSEQQLDELVSQYQTIEANYNNSAQRGAESRIQRNARENQTLDQAVEFAADENQSQADRAGVLVDAVVDVGRTGRDNIADSQRRLNDTLTALEALAQRRADIIAANPNATAAEVRVARESVLVLANARRTTNLQIDGADRNLAAVENQARNNRQAIVDGVVNGNPAALNQLRTVTNQPLQRPITDIPTSLRTEVQPRATPRPPVRPSNAAPASSVAPSATPSVTSTAASAAPRPVRQGTVPGQNGDPYAGLRVPPAQGGSVTPPSQSRTDAQAAAQQQAQAQRNQSRTDRARQEAMARARADNAQIDALSGAINAATGVTGDLVRETERLTRGMDAMVEGLRRTVRPGNVGGVGSSGGSGTGGGSYDEQLIAGDGFPGGIPSIVEWMRGDPIDDGFGPMDAFGAATEYALDAADLAALAAQIDTWQSFELGGTITVADLLPIYAGYDLDNAPIGSSGRSPSSAGSLTPSSAGNSLSLSGSITPSSAPTGMRVDWGGFNLSADPFRVSNGSRPEPGSYADLLRQINGPGNSLLNTNPWTDSPLATRNRDLANALYGPLWSDSPYRVQADPSGRNGRALSNFEVASLFDTEFDTLIRGMGSSFAWLRDFTANGRGGLDRLLAQPFNVLLSWGAGAYDLDLHMTGPLDATTNRFHIYFSAQGSLTAAPFAQLITDCVCNSGSEVILTTALSRNGGVYRVSVFNYGDQSAGTNLANQSQATLQIVRGGTAVSVGNGTTIQGGRTLLTVTPPLGQPGNTWVAAEINPNNGRITSPNIITQSGSSDGVL